MEYKTEQELRDMGDPGRHEQMLRAMSERSRIMSERGRTTVSAPKLDRLDAYVELIERLQAESDD